MNVRTAAYAIGVGGNLALAFLYGGVPGFIVAGIAALLAFVAGMTV